MDKLYIVIPAYNEEENIENVVNQWYPIAEEYGAQMLVINDGSKDRTAEILRECEKRCPLLTALSKRNGGHGAAVLYGYHYALEHHADYIFQTDSDGQTDPAEFPAFWEERKNYDMVIGNRKHREDGVSRVFVTRVLRATIKSCFHVSIPDANTPYRLMRADTLRKYIFLIPQDFHLTNVLISAIFAKKCCKVKYLPITFKPRQGGTNSLNMKKICKLGMQSVKEFQKMNRILQ
ncbi:MAG: glycosyltransferase family 2 protein [Lachnospiraceae bacterium]|nr:glycosyltransferase family 2 protein [Lachnospiraceae bacterium]